MRASSRMRRRNRMAIQAGRRQVRAANRLVTRAASRRPAPVSRGGDAGRVAAVKVRLANRDLERRRSGARNARQFTQIARDMYARVTTKHTHPTASAKRSAAAPSKSRHPVHAARRAKPPKSVKARRR